MVTDAIAGFAFYALEITKEGTVFSPQQREAILNAVSAGGTARVTDLFVISHGWNNDMADARVLYKQLFKNIAQLLAGSRAPGNRKFAIAGVFWPSKKFADEDLIPAGGAASMGAAAAATERSRSAKAIKDKLERLKGTFDRPDAEALEKAKVLVAKLDDSPNAQREFVDLIRSVLPTSVFTRLAHVFPQPGSRAALQTGYQAFELHH